MPNVTLAAIGIQSMDISTAAGASAATGAMKDTNNKISSERAKLGAHQNRLEHTNNNVLNYTENLTLSESRIRDADMAREMMEIAKAQIQEKAGQALLAQANMLQQNSLNLLRA